MRRVNPGIKTLLLAGSLLALILIIACGGAATAPAPESDSSAAPSGAAAGAQPAATAVPSGDSSQAQPAATAAPAQPAAPSGRPTEAANPTPTVEPVEVQAPETDWVHRGKHGRTMKWVARNNPGFWDVHYGASLTTTLTPSGPRFNQLVEYNPVNPEEIIGDLAESWDVSDDGTVYTFYLADARWTDGQPVTASDVVYSLDRITLPDAFRGRTNSLRDFYEHKTAEVIDNRTVRVPIKFPAATFLVNLASDYMKMYPEHVAGPLTQEDANCCPENMIGSGPFIFKDGSWQKQEGYEYVRNDDYFKAPRPYFDGFKVFLIQDPARSIATLKVGQADGTYYPVLSTYTEFVAQLEHDTDGRMRSLFMENVQRAGINYNWLVEPYDDPRVRTALWLVIDQEELVEKILRGNGTVGTHFHVGFAPNESIEALYELPGYRRAADGSKSQADLDEARRLLAEAGYPDGFSGTLTTILSGCTATSAQWYSQVWKNELNLEMEIESSDVATLYAKWRSNDYEVIVSCGSGIILPDPSDILNQWYGMDTMRNSGNWTTTEFDKLKAAQAKELDPDKREQLFTEMVDLLRAEVPHFMPTGWIHAGGTLDYRIRNYHIPRTIQMIHKLDHMWWDEDAEKPPIGTGYQP
jgi:peptide/nickel transport system substrate-binding protein